MLIPFVFGVLDLLSFTQNVGMERKKLGFWDIWNMSFGFLGIQFGFMLQGSSYSRVFQDLGAAKDDIPILWIAAPLTGLLVQPIVGYISDRTWHPRWGRRRPFFLIGAILASAALIVAPYSPMVWIAAGTLWILDASLNISMEPFRALVADKLHEDQRSYGFLVQTLIIGVGTWIAGQLPLWINQLGVSNMAAEGSVPANVRMAFIVGGLVLLGTILYTVFTTKEDPPEDLDAFQHEKNETRGFMVGVRDIGHYILRMPKSMMKISVIQFFSWFAFFTMWNFATVALSEHVYDSPKPEMEKYMANGSQTDLLRNEFVRRSSDDLTYFASAIEMKESGFSTEQAGSLMTSLGEHPKGDKLNEAAAKLSPQVIWFTVLNARNSDAGDKAGSAMGTYGLSSMAFAFILTLFARRRRVNRKLIHMVSLIAGGLGFILMYYADTTAMVNVCYALIGLSWGSVLSMPYAMLSSFIEPRKMGVYMGIFNIFIVLPQIIAAVGGLNLAYKFLFGEETINAMLLAGTSLIIAGLCNLLITNPKAIR